jgi:hypothetical protein
MSLTPLGKSLRLHFESAVASVGQITERAMAFHRRQLARRRVAKARNQPLRDHAVSLSGAKSLEEATHREAAYKQAAEEALREDRTLREDRHNEHNHC